MSVAPGARRQPSAVRMVVVTTEQTARGIVFRVTVRHGGRTATVAVFEAPPADEPQARRRAEACAIRTARGLGVRALAPSAAGNGVPPSPFPVAVVAPVA
jgi:hypothetical protein